jgi:DNA-binding SARP family transcriptional activator
MVARETEAPVTIETLGGFRIRRAGESVPISAWRSKKARDLVKMLVAQGGRPASRELLIDFLWPQEDPAKVGNRLSVALSTVRATLDPEKQYPPDHFVDAAGGALALRLENVVVDVQLFLHDAKAGVTLRAQGRRDEAGERLLSAEAAYAGDFLEADPYDDWAVPLREKARSAYVDVVRALAEDAASSGDRDAAVRYFLRLLERDRFDEAAHLGLIDSLAGGGRHGEALRRHRLYCQCMDEIGVEAAPFRAASAV